MSSKDSSWRVGSRRIPPPSRRPGSGKRWPACGRRGRSSPRSSRDSPPAWPVPCARREDVLCTRRRPQQAASKMRLVEAQLQSSASNEKRMQSEADSLRSEVARPETLLTSVQRIEASLAAKFGDAGRVAPGRVETPPRGEGRRRRQARDVGLEAQGSRCRARGQREGPRGAEGEGDGERHEGSARRTTSPSPRRTRRSCRRRDNILT